ncbi:MAG: phosphoribosyltransferase family protein [Acidimicrobiia bacterium]
MFRDRRDAGAKLASELRSTSPSVVVGLPRGGVVVAAEVAKTLGMPLDIVLVRKLGAPEEPELGIGAIAEGGIEVLNTGLIELLGITVAALDRERERQRRELERRSRLYRFGREPLEVAGRRVILIDDGLATGVTATAAARSLRARGASPLVLAVPVGAPPAVRDLGGEVDEVVCLERPVLFRAVGQWYEDFRQTTDTEVLECLQT